MVRCVERAVEKQRRANGSEEYEVFRVLLYSFITSYDGLGLVLCIFLFYSIEIGAVV